MMEIAVVSEEKHIDCGGAKKSLEMVMEIAVVSEGKHTDCGGAKKR